TDSAGSIGSGLVSCVRCVRSEVVEGRRDNWEGGGARPVTMVFSGSKGLAKLASSSSKSSSVMSSGMVMFKALALSSRGTGLKRPTSGQTDFLQTAGRWPLETRTLRSLVCWSACEGSMAAPYLDGVIAAVAVFLVVLVDLYTYRQDSWSAQDPSLRSPRRSF